MAPALIANVCLRNNRLYAIRRNNLVLNQAFNRSKSSAATVNTVNGNQNVVFGSDQTSSGSQSPKDPLDMSFTNTKEAYKSKATSELMRAWFVLKLSSYSFIIDNNAKVRECVHLNLTVKDRMIYWLRLLPR